MEEPLHPSSTLRNSLPRLQSSTLCVQDYDEIRSFCTAEGVSREPDGHALTPEGSRCAMKADLPEPNSSWQALKAFGFIIGAAAATLPDVPARLFASLC